jgi:hypothetical protein
MLQQVSCLGQLVVAHRAQRVVLLLKLATFLDVVLFRDKALVPAQVNTLDNLSSFFHALQRGGILYPISDGGFHPLPEAIGNLQLGKDVHHLLVDDADPNLLLAAALITAIPAQAAIARFGKVTRIVR